LTGVATPFVSVAQLSRSFAMGTRQQCVLSDINFALQQGEVVALLGRSGSGKSTLLNVLSGIDLPDVGEVVIDGVSLFALNEKQRTLFRRQHIGFIYQAFNLIPSLTAQENIALMLELNGHAPARALATAASLLSDIGMADNIDQYPATLSGGEQQRVAILRALAPRPKLVLADEPTGNLDASTGKQMLQMLRDSLRLTNSTALLVTHSLAVAQTADRVVTLEDGKLMERGGAFAW
jgi:putative ABC transport system ATP-binding protein